MIATVDLVKDMYSGVPEDGFQRDVECAAEVITSLHPRPGMNFDKTNLIIKGLQIIRGLHCTRASFQQNLDQRKLQNWETEDFIVFENIYYGSYNDAIKKTTHNNIAFPVYICDQTKPHTRFFKAGMFTIQQNFKPAVTLTNSNGYTIRGYLLLQRQSGNTTTES